MQIATIRTTIITGVTIYMYNQLLIYILKKKINHDGQRTNILGPKGNRT